jgi:hypothetical protein
MRQAQEGRAGNLASRTVSGGKGVHFTLGKQCQEDSRNIESDRTGQSY